MNVQLITVELNTAPPLSAELFIKVQLIALTLCNAPPLVPPLPVNVQLIAIDPPGSLEYIATLSLSKVQFIAVAFPKIAP